MACTEGDDGKVNELLEAGANPDVKVRGTGPGMRVLASGCSSSARACSPRREKPAWR